jgi:hypothetical protein
MSKDGSKGSANKWKRKAIERGIENKKLKKRLSEVTASRDAWRSKFYGMKRGREQASSVRAYGHWHSLQVARLCVLLQGYGGMSLRCCRHCVSQMLLVFELNCRVPSASTIRRWVIKSGFYQVMEGDRQGSWVVWVDESIFLSGEQLLLVLGLDVGNWKYDRPVKLEDVCVLAVRHQPSWNKEQVKEVLEELGGRMKIIYGISDRAQTLRSAFELAAIAHVSDCTHVIANLLEKLYKTDEPFKTFCSWAGKLRAKWAMSKDKAPYMPPAQRTQARFANIFPLVKWGYKILKMKPVNFLGLPKDVRLELLEVKHYKSMLLDLQALQDTCVQMFKILKKRGLSKKGYRTIKSIKSKRKTDKVKTFHRQVCQYLEDILPLTKQHAVILCCSDIIESAFGKFKLKVNSKSPFGLTEFVYSIANFTQPITQKHIKEALEKVTHKDILQKRGNAKSLAQIRRDFFGQNGGK